MAEIRYKMGIEKSPNAGLGNRRSIRLSYGANGVFPRVSGKTRQRGTRKVRNKCRFAPSQTQAQFVPPPFTRHNQGEVK